MTNRPGTERSASTAASPWSIGVQVVRPVDRRGDAGVERLDGRQPVAGGDVLGAELLAVLEVVPDEVLGERPVGAVAAHRGLPHVPVGVDHPGHDDAAAGVDLLRALGHVQAGADGGDPVVDDQDVGVGQDRAGVVHGQHRAAAQHHRAAGLRRLSSGWVIVSSSDVVVTESDGCPHGGHAVRCAVTFGAAAGACQEGRRGPLGWLLTAVDSRRAAETAETRTDSRPQTTTTEGCDRR